MFTINYTSTLQAVKELAGRHSEDGDLFGTHSLRRGAAQDVQDCNPDLYHLLAAGSWTTAAFQEYMTWMEIQDKCISAVVREDPFKGRAKPTMAPEVCQDNASDSDYDA